MADTINAKTGRSIAKDIAVLIGTKSRVHLGVGLSTANAIKLLEPNVEMNSPDEPRWLT